MWCIPPHQNADFVAKMEDVLDVYALPYDEKFPVVCIDEKPYQLLGERRHPLILRQGSTEKIDNEYERRGTSAIFVMVEPLKGWFHANAREHRTAIDFAQEIETLIAVFPKAEKIRLVMDNLNTHVISSLYKAFPAAKARKLAQKLEIHFTPKHGSWLNIAKIAISILSKKCINKRIPTMEQLNREIDIWEGYQNTNQKQIDWQFTTSDARIKLKTLYPVF
jgi:hypothetical protein